MHGTRNDYKLVEQDDYLLIDGLHEGIVSEELWNRSMIKAAAFPFVKVKELKDYDFELQPGVNEQEMRELSSLGFLEKNENIVFLGPSGAINPGIRAWNMTLAQENRKKNSFKREKVNNTDHPHILFEILN